jgi:integrase
MKSPGRLSTRVGEERGSHQFAQGAVEGAAGQAAAPEIPGLLSTKALPYADLPRFMAELRRRDSLSARALEYTILTAVRTSDTLGAVRSEIDRDEGRPRGPAHGQQRHGKRDHVVPLFDRALEIVDGRSIASYVFFGIPWGQ